MRRHRRTFVTAWILFALTCAALAGVKFWQNRALTRNEIAANQNYAAAFRAALAGSRQVPKLYFDLHNAWSKQRGPRPTTQVVAEQLNGGNGFPVIPPPDRRGWTGIPWTDPANGAMWTLWFEAGTWQQWSGGPTVPPAPPPLPLPPGWLEVESAREVLAQAAPYVWLATFALMGIAATVAPRNRRAAWAQPVAHAMLAIAVAGTVAKLLARTTPLAVSGLASPDFRVRLMIHGGTLIASTLVLWLLARWSRIPPDVTRCATCDYDLTGNVSGVCPECGTTRGTGFNPC